LSTWCVLSSF